MVVVGEGFFCYFQFDSSTFSDILRDLLYRYKLGYIGTLRALGNMVENATGRRYAISTLLRKVRKLVSSCRLNWFLIQIVQH